MVKAPAPMGSHVEVEVELLGSDLCACQGCLTEDSLPFPLLTPSRDHLHLLRVPALAQMQKALQR